MRLDSSIKGKGPGAGSLSGIWVGYRECRLKPDLLLIYSKPDADTLRLVRLGSPQGMTLAAFERIAVNKVTTDFAQSWWRRSE